MPYPGWISDPPTPLTPAARRLLRRVWELQQETGCCYAYQETLATDLGVARKTVTRAAAQLEQQGYITVDLMPVYANGHKTNRRGNHMRITSEAEVLSQNKNPFAALRRRIERIADDPTETDDSRLHANAGAASEDVRCGFAEDGDGAFDPESAFPADPDWAGPTGDFEDSD